MTIIEGLIYLVAAALRLFHLGAANLWYDETFTYLVTGKDIPGMFAAIVGDVHPPLFYLVTMPITHLAGLNETLLRLPSVLLSLLAIWLTGQIADQLKLSRPARLIAMAMLALLPCELYYAQEARMYALFQVLVLAWLLYTLRRNWTMAIVTGSLALYTHNYAVFYLVVIGLLGVWGEVFRPVILDPNDAHFGPGDECQFHKAFYAMVIPVLIYLPWQMVLIGQMANVASAYWIQPLTWGGVANAVYTIFWSFYPSDMMAVMAALLTFGLVLYALIRTRRELYKSSYRVLVLVGLGPLVMACLASLIWRPILLPRGLIGSTPMLCMLVASALAAGPRWKPAYVGAMLAPILAMGIGSYYTKIPIDKGQIRQDVANLTANWQPGDLLVHTNSSSFVRWQAYAPELPQYLLHTCEEFNAAELAEDTREALGAYDDDGDLDDARRIWLIFDAGPTSETCETQRAREMIGDRPPTMLLSNSQYFASNLWLIER